MTPSKRKLPSFGFMAVIGTYTLLIVFLLWGFSTPDLDRIWTLHHELKIGTTYKLKGSDRKILLNAMARHSELARALLPQGEIGLISANNRGWIYTPIATIIRTPKSDKYRVLRFEIQTSTDLIPYKIRVKGVSWQKDLSVDRQGIMDFELPRVKQTPEIITVQLRGDAFEPDPSILGVRIGFVTHQQATETHD